MTTQDDVLTLEEAAEMVKLSKPVLRRALTSYIAAGRAEGEGLAGGLASGAAGWRTTRRALLTWVESGMPGLDKAVDDEAGLS